MEWKDLPEHRPDLGSLLVVLKAPAGPARTQYLASWIDSATINGTAAYLLSCDFQAAGPWAGLTDLLLQLLPEIQRQMPDLLERHAAELTLVLPRLRRILPVENATLTESVSPQEKVRNYPMDRAYRIVHGLIDLLTTWSAGAGISHWVLACDHFEEGGALVQMFFRELMRRRSGTFGITLVLATAPDQSEEGSFQGNFTRIHVRPELPNIETIRPSEAEMRALAETLEEQVCRDDIALEDRLPELIQSWLQSDAPAKALPWQAHAFAMYNHYGFYEDALRYGAIVVTNLETTLRMSQRFTRWNIVGSLCNCYLALGRPEEALKIIEREAITKISDPADLVRIFYVLTLIYSRFLPKPDYAKGEAYVEQGLAMLENSDLPEHEKCFLHVFTLNGLAFIRHRQGRPQEALELCRTGFALLQERLAPGEHILHRSVLLYNMAQVYSALRAHDLALEYYSASIQYDPNYSEYYNERGNTYLSQGRLQEAIMDYHEAIRLSAPYQEVWTNLGQAYKLSGDLDEAIRAYSRALDIDPGQILPRLGRAQALDSLGQMAEAIEDYTAALDLDPTQPLTLANRASLLYEMGRLQEAVADLDRAISLAPDNLDLFYNRAVALSDLGRREEAATDLRAVLGRRPDAEERAEIEARIALLAGPALPTRGAASFSA